MLPPFTQAVCRPQLQPFCSLDADTASPPDSPSSTGGAELPLRLRLPASVLPTLQWTPNARKAVYLKPQERGSRAACHKLQQLALFFVGETFHNSPEDLNDRMVGRVASCGQMNTFNETQLKGAAEQTAEKGLRVAQICNDTQWVPSTGWVFPSAAEQTAEKGLRVAQICNDTQWVPSTGWVFPSAAEQTAEKGLRVAQICNGTQWVPSTGWVFPSAAEQTAEKGLRVAQICNDTQWVPSTGWVFPSAAEQTAEKGLRVAQICNDTQWVPSTGWVFPSMIWCLILSSLLLIITYYSDMNTTTNNQSHYMMRPLFQNITSATYSF
ncbi:hypothetical protein P7K49_026037 [Saguinus oedipus]|uniref:Uncharacterized protein n=1 Tax=Saguinus oedipus TaxID=9490 RepID=A0ABQ9UIX5_SAGOE|nr:hypothetical protein P7K49_026037 [Saguinus oedipus]